MADEGHTPLESYQWSAARVEHTSRFIKQLGVVIGSVLLVVTLGLLIWNTAVFGSQVNAIQRQQVAFHQDSNGVNARLNCEASAFNNIIAQLAAAQSAEARHAPAPKFVYPKPC